MTLEPKIIVVRALSHSSDSSASLWTPKIIGQNIGRSPFWS
jgi:hypothetical protein